MLMRLQRRRRAMPGSAGGARCGEAAALVSRHQARRMQAVAALHTCGAGQKAMLFFRLLVTRTFQVWSSIEGPLGYGPSTLPLRQAE